MWTIHFTTVFVVQHMDRTFVTTPDANGNLDLLTDEDGSPTDYG